MARIAFLFPGQGSQETGMGKELCDAYPAIKRGYFDRADEVLGFSLSRLCFEGPDEELVKTENQQPAIFLVSAAAAAVLADRGVEPEAVAGHSLGEYSALVAAGAFGFEQGLLLTRRRGELMAEVGERTGGVMAAVRGLPSADVEEICRDASAVGTVEVANFNSPSQTVISGQESAVERAMELAGQRGPKRPVRLNVSAPFHSSLMAPLVEAFQPVLDAVPIHDPKLPVVANVTAEYERTADEVRRNLIDQLASAVHWTASMQRLIDDGFDTFVEVGPGHVLTGLLRAINSVNPAGRPAVTRLNASDPDTVDEVVAHLTGP